MRKQGNHPGIRVRHSRSCPMHNGGSCRCQPAYEAWAYSIKDGKKIRKTFPTLAAAKGWRADAMSGLRKGTMRAPSTVTLREAADAWLEGATSGAIRTRSGDPYKPSAVRSYNQALRLRVLPEFGAAKLSAIDRSDLQALVDQLVADRVDASTIRNTLMPLRAIYRRAIARSEVALNPTAGLELPAVRGRRTRIATAGEAAALIDALPEPERPVWACAFYAGLRRGELQALRDEDIDLAAALIHIRHAWDPAAGLIEPKSRAGARKVPIVGALRVHLAAHKLRRSMREGFFFGRGNTPFCAETLRNRSNKAWSNADLVPIGLHEARHTYASLAIAAGVNAKALSTYMGHSSITITLDRYGHLMPGNETEAARLLDSYLARAVESSVDEPPVMRSETRSYGHQDRHG